MNLLSRFFPQFGPAGEDDYQPLDDKRRARLRWALELELELMGPGPNSEPHPRPVMMVRQTRERDGSWPCENSWIGGLPRLGRAKWPKAEDGGPLPFVAQIHLADLSRNCPESPLPGDGWLALFLGDGGAVHVTAADPKPSRHPDGDRARDQIPCWPLEQLVLEIPPELRVYHNEEHHHPIREAQITLLHLLMKERQGPFSIGNLRRAGKCDFETSYWQGAILASQMLSRALEMQNQAICEQQEWVKLARAELAELQEATYRDDNRIAELENGILNAETEIPWQQNDVDVFAKFCASFAELVQDKDPWSAMTREDYQPVLEKLSEAHGRFDHVLPTGMPCNLEEMQDLVLRQLITGDAKDFKHMPADVLEVINQDFRLASGGQHQMFGLGYGEPLGFADGEENLLLFQMMPDDMLDTHMHGVDAWQFWISRADAEEGNWDKVKLRVCAR